jgi:hypothetical protein
MGGVRLGNSDSVLYQERSIASFAALVVSVYVLHGIGTSPNRKFGTSVLTSTILHIDPDADSVLHENGRTDRSKRILGQYFFLRHKPASSLETRNGKSSRIKPD